MTNMSKNIITIKERIARAVQRSKGDLKRIKLIAVTKTASIEQIKEAMQEGINNFGENRVKPAKEKIKYFSDIPTIMWHMIGHLQSNKVKDAVPLFNFIHSVDSISLASEINKRCAEIGIIMPIFIETNIAAENSKYGIYLDDLPKFLGEIKKLQSIKPIGLMTMPPFTENPENSRIYFKELAEAGKKYGLQELSMGTSQDFEVAIEEGATIIRVGREVFGESSK